MTAIRALCLSLLLGSAAPRALAADLLIERADGVRVHFTVELALTPAARSRGLMGRGALPARHGMWFDFGAPAAVQMWMKDTPLSLDMAFIDTGGRLVHIVADTVPFSLTRLAAPRPVRYVLEVAAGSLAAAAIAAGARVVLTAALAGAGHSPRAATKAAKPLLKPANDTGTSIASRSAS